MTQMLLAIAPIFLLIILGHALRRGGIPTVDFSVHHQILFEHCCGSFSECGEERYRVKIQIAPEIFQFVALHYWKQFLHLFHYFGPFSLMAKLQISSLSLLRIHDCTNNLGVTEEEEVVRCNDYSF